MIGEIKSSGLIIIRSEKKDNVDWDSDPFVDTVWHRWLVAFRCRHQGSDDCIWMILE